MRVAFINRWGRGGGVIWDIKIAQQLEASGIDVTFHIGQSRDGSFKHPVSALPDYEGYRMPEFPDYAKAAPPGIGGALVDLDTHLFSKRVNSRIDYSAYDIIHITGIISYHRYVDNTPTVLKLCGPPYSLFYDVINPFSTSYDGLKKHDGVVATGITVEEINRRTNCDVKTINPGVDTNTFIPGTSQNKEISILFVGRFAPSKNIPLLLQSFASIHEIHPQTTLTLVGDGPLKERLLGQAESLGIRDVIKTPGYVPQNELTEYYQSADIFALSSNHESFGMVILEAMSAGLPVVAPAVGWIPEIIDNGETGFIYDTGSETQLTRYLNRLVSQAELRESIGKHARKSIKQKYDWRSRAEKLIELYNDVVN